ncbi:MAG: alpha/beta fold hydrolase [Xanthomonadales bacterium]|nr:alpha/beta fold hydrolase [Xanthomonadales bacterium]
MNTPDFMPPRGLRNPHLQSVLASHRLRRWLQRARLLELERAAESVIVDCGQGVRLQGFHNPAANGRPRGLVVLLHGWEGSASSTYLVNTAAILNDAGFDVFRLEFRDHGRGQHLNPGLFHSCRIDEVVGAIANVARRWPIAPLLLAGYSLGGNFALRVAQRAPAAGLDLRRVIAVSPAIDPSGVLQAMESAPFFYRRYFMYKWWRSLRRKQAAFPDRYQFGPELRRLGMRALTTELIQRYSEFDSLAAYLDGYSLAGERLADLAVATDIVTALDDPIIPVAEFHRLRLPACARLHLVDHGGHCGFLENWRLQGWGERFVLAACEHAVAMDEAGEGAGSDAGGFDAALRLVAETPQAAL